MRLGRLFGFVLALILLLGFCAPAVRAQGSVIIEANPQLFATMCALYAAGHDAEVGGAVHPLRARVRARMGMVHGPATDALREFYRNHRFNDPAATLSRYVSFALVVGSAPKFEFTGKRETLPPDAAALEGFNDILAAFYAEGQIGELWQQVRPEYDKEVRRLQDPVSRIMIVSSGYLRELVDPQGLRRFYVLIEPLVGAKTNVRSYGDANVIVMNPGAEIPVDDIRHAFLHFMLDPLPLRFRAQVEGRKAILNLAARAPRLPNEFKEDFSTFFTENLVRAAELRLRRAGNKEVERALSEADVEGFVLVRALFRELEKFEKAEPAMNYYYPELVRGISISEETRRLERMEFAAAAPAPAAVPVPEISALEQELIHAEQLIAAQKGDAAAEAFSRILAKDGSQPRALYGYAVASVLQRESERAKEYFRRLFQLLSEPVTGPAGPPSDARILAWSHVYLGRIYDVEGNRELALSEYRAAMAVEGAPELARNAAKRGLEQGFGPAQEPARKP